MQIGHVQQRRELRRFLADRRESDHLAALDRLQYATAAAIGAESRV